VIAYRQDEWTAVHLMCAFGKSEACTRVLRGVCSYVRAAAAAGLFYGIASGVAHLLVACVLVNVSNQYGMSHAPFGGLGLLGPVVCTMRAFDEGVSLSLMLASTACIVEKSTLTTSITCGRCELAVYPGRLCTVLSLQLMC
jgi:hypothetical protein